MSWCDLGLTFDFALMTLNLKKFCTGYMSETIRCRRLVFVRDIG